MPTIEDFESKIIKTGNCWEWTGYIKSNGYGQLTQNGKTVLSHRVIYELYKGEIPHGLDLDHLCRNRKCVNPNHLEPVTRKENLMRGVGLTSQNLKKTHCPKGHEYNGVNLYRDTKNFRRCRECNRITQYNWRMNK